MRIKIVISKEDCVKVVEGDVDNIAKSLMDGDIPSFLFNGINFIKKVSSCSQVEEYIRGKKEYRDALFKSLSTLIEKEVIEKGLE